jgi:hypothetical protein
MVATLVMAAATSVDWCRYWQPAGLSVVWEYLENAVKGPQYLTKPPEANNASQSACYKDYRPHRTRNGHCPEEEQ